MVRRCGVLAALLLISQLAPAQELTARLTHPVDAAVDVDVNQPIRWTSVEGAQAYYLYVGSTPGAKDLLNSGELQVTSILARTLPSGKEVFARLHTKHDGVWRSVDSRFTVRAVAQILQPLDGAVNVDVRQPIRWTAVEGAEAYYLYVGSAPGLKDLAQSGETQATAFTAPFLPGGKEVFARLHTKHDGVWRSVDSRFTVRAVAQMLHPLDGQVDVDVRQPLRWTSVEGAQAYYLYVGSAPGAKDLLNSGELQGTSILARSLPGGKEVFARLHTKHDGVWRSVDSHFTVRAVAQILQPLDGAVNVDVRQSIRWTAVAGAEAYYLYVGSAPGLKDLAQSGETQATAFTAPYLPGGKTVYLRLYTYFGGQWKYVDSRFTVRPVAQIIGLVSGAVDVDVRQPIRWTAVEGAQAYYLYVGTAPGLKDLVNSGEIQATSYTAPFLPAGQTVYVRLFTKVDGVWRYVDFQFHVRAVAQLLNPLDGAVNVDVREPIRWTSVNGAQAYYLYVGSTPGAKDLVNSGETQATSDVARYLPGGAQVYVRLFTKHGGQWRSIDAVFHVLPVAQLFDPEDGRQEVDLGPGLRWTRVELADGYRLQLGTGAGANDLLDSGVVADLQTSAPTVPGGITVHARLSTLFAGTWRYVDSSFATRPVPRLITPAHAEHDVPTTVEFEWTRVEGATGYRLAVGTTQGTGDVSDQTVASTNVLVAGMPAERTLYARVFAQANGAWHFTDSGFATSSAPPPAAFVYPAQAEAIDAALPFQWDPVPFAESYHLTIGSTAGASDIFDSGPIKVTRRLVSDLPAGVPLYARLQTNFVSGSSAMNEVEFQVQSALIPASARIELARWLTVSVRAMATSDNIPVLHTLLADVVQAAAGATALCSDFVTAFVAAGDQAGLGLDLRYFETCLNPSNDVDCHVAVEVRDPETDAWLLLDPTLGVAVREAGSSRPLGGRDVSEALRNGSVPDLELEFLDAAAETRVRAYYIDYPLLFLNPFVPGTRDPMFAERSPLEFFDAAGSAVVDDPGSYAIRCTEGVEDVTVRVDNQTWTISCAGSEGLTPVFQGENIDIPLPQDPSPEILRLQRVLF